MKGENEAEDVATHLENDSLPGPHNRDSILSTIDFIVAKLMSLFISTASLLFRR